MRSTFKPQMKYNRHKRTKNKYSHKKRSWGYAHNVSKSNIENLNEVLRMHKTQCADGKGAWKLVPKDSCEVYKDRRKRQMDRDGNAEDKEQRQDSKKRKEMRNKKKTYRKSYYKKPKKRTVRQPPESSISSCTSCTAATTSYTSSISEMEYD